MNTQTLSNLLIQMKCLWPELSLLIVAAVAMMVHVFAKKNGRYLAGITTLIGIVIVFFLMIFSPQNGGELLSGSLTADSFSHFLKILFLLSGGFAILLCFRFFKVEEYMVGETYYLLLLAIIGMMFTVSALDLITFYVSFELFAILSYILAGIFKKERRSSEAGLKYFILGVLSSAIMLLGMTFLYGNTGQVTFAKIGEAITTLDNHMIIMGMFLFFIGLFFKVAMVPFHMWTPDVYEGAPTPLVVFLSTAPKIAVFGVFIRLLSLSFSQLQPKWSILFSVIAMVTMFWGNIAALRQDNLKRMMAYSSIAHAGYIMIGLAAFGTRGSEAILFYLFVYLFMNAAAFTLVLLTQKKCGFGENIDSLNGLAQRAPMMAAGIILLLLSLTGIPPTAGFFGKYYLLAAAVEQKMYLLAIVGAINSVISLFYYFRIGKAMFMETDNPETSVSKNYFVQSVLVFSFIIILLIGILPQQLMEIVSLVVPH